MRAQRERARSRDRKADSSFGRNDKKTDRYERTDRNDKRFKAKLGRCVAVRRELPETDVGSTRVGMFRLRMPIRCAHRHASLNMTADIS